MSSSEITLDAFLIPSEQINLATKDFSAETRIGDGGLGMVYKGQLSESWKNRTAAFKHSNPLAYKEKHDFRDRVELISSFNHENIIPFIGYCHEGDKMIIASEYAINGSLDRHLQDPNKRRCLTWAQRLKICIGAARGLEYLHSGLGEGRTVVHRNIKSTNILLDGNLEAKISVSGGPIIHRNGIMTTFDAGSSFYMDPNYYESGILNKESDVYSLGVVLFEMLSGMLANDTRSIDDQKPHTLMNLVRSYYDNGLEKLIDPLIRTQIDDSSFHTFKEVAWQCITFRSKDRPKMANIIQSIEEAFDIQNHGAASTNATGINQFQDLERLLIPLKEIKFATKDFCPETRIGVGGYGAVYKGQLSARWQNQKVACDRIDPCIGMHKFRNQVEMMSSFNHENLVVFLGYCDENNEKIIVTKLINNESLDQYLTNPDKMCSLTWAKRLKICRAVARGLKYLHSGLGEHNIVIHRDVKSANILLDDDNSEAKLCGFVLSTLIDRNQPQVYEPAAGTPFYLDPIYNESGLVKTELDIYSFGVVLFEMLSGMLASSRRSIGDNQPQTLINLARHYCEEEPENLIDPQIRDQVHVHSFQVFKEIAYRCISLNIKDRPTINTIIKRIEEALDIQNEAASSITTPSQQFQDLESFRIPLEVINLATQHFSAETQIGDGGFGAVYKGQLSERWQNCTVAIKRLDPRGQQGRKEFLTELNLIPIFHHKNIIPFIGYCDEGNEMIIVSEYAGNHSLDHHLLDINKRSCLTWTQRLTICLGAARGINYLHSGLRENIIHRDIKSANILLDENLEAKVCDFGLSKQGSRNQQHSHFYTKAAGTKFYLDPIYHESGILRKESDVYSFGVVLFEILSGMLAFHSSSFGDGKPQPLINLVRRYYDDGFEKLIDPLIRGQIDSRCLRTFKELAYQCISYTSKERPTMDTIVERIEDALDFQMDRN